MPSRPVIRRAVGDSDQKRFAGYGSNDEMTERDDAIERGRGMRCRTVPKAIKFGGQEKHRIEGGKRRERCGLRAGRVHVGRIVRGGEGRRRQFLAASGRFHPGTALMPASLAAGALLIGRGGAARNGTAIGMRWEGRVETKEFAAPVGTAARDGRRTGGQHHERRQPDQGDPKR